MKSRLSRVIQIAFTVLVTAVIVVYLIQIDWSSLEGLQLTVVPFVAATLIALLYRYWGALIWLVLLRRLGATGLRPQGHELVYVYAKSWLGRYLLGAGTWILGKIYFASQHGIGRAKLAVSGLLEAALQLAATLLVGLAFLLVDPRLASVGNGATIAAAIALVLVVVAMIPPVFRWGITLALRILRRPPLDPADLPDSKSILVGGGMYVVATFITGISYFFIAQSVYADIAWTDMPYVVGAASIASAISLLAVFAPGGIGVREGVQVAFFVLIMPVELAVIVTVLMRLWSVGVDVLFFGVAAVTRRLARGGGPADAQAAP